MQAKSRNNKKMIKWSTWDYWLQCREWLYQLWLSQCNFQCTHEIFH